MTKHGQIAQQLRGAIIDGDYAAGDVLPSIDELMQHYGVARDTVRDAEGALANQGFVTRKRGVGTVVRDLTPVPLRYDGVTAARTWEAQTNGTTQLAEAEWSTADTNIAARLSIPAGTALVRRVWYFRIAGSVIKIGEQWITEEVARAVEATTGTTLATNSEPATRNLFALFDDTGIAHHSITEDVWTRMPWLDEQEIMGLPPTGVPVLVVYRTSHTSEGKPLETTTFISDGSRDSASFTVYR